GLVRILGQLEARDVRHALRPMPALLQQPTVGLLPEPGELSAHPRVGTEPDREVRLAAAERDVRRPDRLRAVRCRERPDLGHHPLLVVTADRGDRSAGTPAELVTLRSGEAGPV